ncbi:MAG: hypothetical protein VW456_04700, partial [Alphaproteobacteria bacterium]
LLTLQCSVRGQPPVWPEQKGHCSLDDVWLGDYLSILTAAFYVVSEIRELTMRDLAVRAITLRTVFMEGVDHDQITQ